MARREIKFEDSEVGYVNEWENAEEVEFDVEAPIAPRSNKQQADEAAQMSVGQPYKYLPDDLEKSRLANAGFKEKYIDPVTGAFEEAYLGMAGFDPADRLTGGLPAHEAEKAIFRELPSQAITAPIPIPGVGKLGTLVKAVEIAKAPGLSAFIKVAANTISVGGESAMQQYIANALVPRRNMSEGVKEAGLIGSGLGFLGTAGAVGYQAYKTHKLGKISAEMANQITDELDFVITEVPPGTVVGADDVAPTQRFTHDDRVKIVGGQGGPQPPSEVAPPGREAFVGAERKAADIQVRPPVPKEVAPYADKDFMPMTAKITVDADGHALARVYETDVSTGQIRWMEIPLDSVQARMKFGRNYGGVHVEMGPGVDELSKGWSQAEKDFVFRGPPEGYYLGDEVAGLGPKTAGGKKGALKHNMDAPPGGVMPDTMVVLQGTKPSMRVTLGSTAEGQGMSAREIAEELRRRKGAKAPGAKPGPRDNMATGKQPALKNILDFDQIVADLNKRPLTLGSEGFQNVDEVVEEIGAIEKMLLEGSGERVLELENRLVRLRQLRDSAPTPTAPMGVGDMATINKDAPLAVPWYSPAGRARALDDAKKERPALFGVDEPRNTLPPTKAPKDFASKVLGAAGKEPPTVKVLTADIKDLKPPDPPKPPPPPPGGTGPVHGPNPRPLTPQQLQTMNTVSTLIPELQRARDKGLINKILDGVLADHLRGPLEAQQLIAAMNGARALGDPRANIKAARAAMPGKRLFDAAASDLSRVAEGRINMADFAKKHPEVAKEALKMFDNMITDMRDTSAKLEAMGFVPQDYTALRDAGLIDQYAARQYYAYFLGKGQWAKVVPQATIDRGVKYLVTQHPNLSESAVADIVMDAIGADDPIEVLAAHGLFGNRPVNHLKHRDITLPAPIRELLGEIQSGPLRIAISHAKQQSLLHQAYIWREIAMDPAKMSAQRSVDFPVPVPNDKRLYGPAAGMYIPNDLEPLLHMPKAASHAPGLARALGIPLGRFIKGNQVILNPRAWVNNAIRNLKGSVLAGGLVPWKPIQAAQDSLHAVSALRAFTKDPSSKGLGALVLEAKRVGAIPQGFGAVEGVAKESDIIFKELAESLGKTSNLYDSLGNLKDKLDILNWPRKRLAPAYDAIDAFFKMANYVGLRRKFLGQGMDLEDAARMAALRINQSFPNFEHVGKWVDTARQGPYGAIAPYLSSELEDVRVNAMLPKRFTEEPELIGRVAASGAMFAGAIAGIGAWRRLNGITDEDVNEGQMVSAKANKVYRPGEVALPWRDDKGRVQYVDMSTWVPELQLLNGHPDDPTWAKVAYNLGTKITGQQGTFQEPLIKEFADRIGLTTPVPGQTPSGVAFNEQGTLQAISSYLLQPGPVPGVAANAINAYRQWKGPHQPTQEPLTGAQALGRQVLPTVRPVTLPSVDGESPTRERNRVEYMGRIKSLRNEIIRVQNNERYTEEEKEAKTEAITAEIDRLSEEQDVVDRSSER